MGKRTVSFLRAHTKGCEEIGDQLIPRACPVFFHGLVWSRGFGKTSHCNRVAGSPPLLDLIAGSLNGVWMLVHMVCFALLISNITCQDSRRWGCAGSSSQCTSGTS